MSYRKSIVAANVIVFSSLAIILTVIKAEIPFPLLPYLKFDFAEIPVMIVLLIAGPIPALATAIIHWISLTIAHGWVLGPLMKFLAVAPMIFGFWLGFEAYKRFSKSTQYNFTLAFGLGMILGIIIRVIVCSVTNVVIFLFVAPEYLTFAEITLKSVGIAITSTLDVWIWALALTALFNTIHVPISSLIATITFKAAALRIPHIAEKTWVFVKRQKNTRKTY